MKEKIYFILPHLLQNIVISAHNFLANRKRYGGLFKEFLILFKKNRNLTLIELKEIQRKRYKIYLDNVVGNSPYYTDKLSKITEFNKIENIKNLPILNKETLRINIDNIYTIDKDKGIV